MIKKSENTWPLSIDIKLAQTSSGGTDRESQPNHCCATTAAATSTTTTGVSHTIAFADDSETR